KSRPAKTSRFFVHWPGRSERIRLRTRGRGRTPDATAAAGSAAIPDEEVLRAITRGRRSDLRRGREAADCLVLGVERLEDGQELRDRQQVGDSLRQVQQLQ